MKTNRIFIQVRKPQAHVPNDLGEVAEGWFKLEDNKVILTDREGQAIAGRWSTELDNGESAAAIARLMLRQQLDVGRRSHGFNAPIQYPAKRYV
jgi:hypothetical protein